MREQKLRDTYFAELKNNNKKCFYNKQNEQFHMKSTHQQNVTLSSQYYYK